MIWQGKYENYNSLLCEFEHQANTALKASLRSYFNGAEIEIRWWNDKIITMMITSVCSLHINYTMGWALFLSGLAARHTNVLL